MVTSVTCGDCVHDVSPDASELVLVVPLVVGHQEVQSSRA